MASVEAMDRETALEEVVSRGMSAILSFNNLIIIKTEQDPAIKYVLF